MTRAEICASDDFETIDRLQAVLAELGVVADDTWHDTPVGTGLTRYRRGGDELTVFRDAWVMDVAGPEELVELVLQHLGRG